MRKIELESNIGKLSVLNVKIIGLFSIGFLIFSIFNSDMEGTIFMCFFLLFYYFTVFRKILNNKSVYFDNEFLYFENIQIPLIDVDRIKENKIFYGNNVIKFNMFFCENVTLLKGFIEDAKMKQI